MNNHIYLRVFQLIFLTHLPIVVLYRHKKLMRISHRSVVKLNTENKELKKRIDKVEMRLDASQQVNVCYAKVAGQANKIDELCSNIEVKDDWISDYMSKA